MTCTDRPRDVRSLATWLSPDDAGRLFEASLTAESPGFRVVWGVSANARRWVSLAEAETLGFAPQDDAEVYAAEILEHNATGAQGDEHGFIGGAYTSDTFDVDRLHDGAAGTASTSPAVRLVRRMLGSRRR
jgi:hypothetical protein